MAKNNYSQFNEKGLFCDIIKTKGLLEVRLISI